MNLQDLIANSTQDMRNQLDRIRIASSHNGLKGTGAEEILAEFLRERLPASLGVTAGQVVDRDGNISKQVDVVIYDATRTPMLFTSPGQTWSTIPAEGVLAVIEVKMHLTATDIPKVLANCASVLDLRRDAYIGESTKKFSAHGTTHAELPIAYYLFAFESDSMYAERFNALQADLDLAKRMTGACYLDRGVSLYFQIRGSSPIFVELPSPPGVMVDVTTEDALLVWFTALSAVIFQAAVRPISLLEYARDAFTNMSGTLGKQSQEDRNKLLADMTDHILEQVGVAPGIGEKMFVTKERPTVEEVDALQAAGAIVTFDENGQPHITLPEQTS